MTITFLNVLYLNLYGVLIFQRKAKGQELLDQVCNQLNLLERDYFGLSYEDRRDSHNWLEMDKRIGKFLKSEFNFSTQFVNVAIYILIYIMYFQANHGCLILK